jgi:hypothetical protein
VGVTVSGFAEEILQAASSFSSYCYSIQNPSINVDVFENLKLLKFTYFY